MKIRANNLWIWGLFLLGLCFGCKEHSKTQLTTSNSKANTELADTTLIPLTPPVPLKQVIQGQIFIKSTDSEILKLGLVEVKLYDENTVLNYISNCLSTFEGLHSNAQQQLHI